MSLSLSDPLAAAILHKPLAAQSNCANGHPSLAETVSITAPSASERLSQADACSDAENASELNDDSSDDADSCFDRGEQDDVDYDKFNVLTRLLEFCWPGDACSLLTLQIVVHQDLLGVEGTGGVVWPVCEHLCRLLVAQQQQLIRQPAVEQDASDAKGRSTPWYDVRGRRVLELGCGPGLASFLCAALGADVIGTDGDMDAIRLANKAILANSHLFVPATSQGQQPHPQGAHGTAALSDVGSSTSSFWPRSGRVRFRQFWWGTDSVTSLGDDGAAYIPDVVVACDVMYDPAGVADFSVTMKDIFEVNPNAVMVLALQRRRPELEDVALRQWVEEYDVRVVWHQGKYSAITIQKK
jgi:predicted nicotinamide N-methyase